MNFLPSIVCDQSVPMWRLTDRMVRSTLVTACRLATSPTSTSPFLANATTDGVVRAPSALAMTVGSPPSRTETTELVVPRSMPTARVMEGPPGCRSGRCERFAGLVHRPCCQTERSSARSGIIEDASVGLNSPEPTRVPPPRDRCGRFAVISGGIAPAETARRRAAGRASRRRKPVAGKGSALGWRVVGLGSAVLAGIAARKMAVTTWKLAMGDDPPVNPEAPDVVASARRSAGPSPPGRSSAWPGCSPPARPRPTGSAAPGTSPGHGEGHALSAHAVR